jgi:hypothetical protein
MSTWLLFAFAFGAAVRLTRLVTADYITGPIARLIDRWGRTQRLPVDV